MRPTRMPLGCSAQLGDRADRIGHRGDLLAAFGDGLDDRAVELEAIDERRGEAGARAPPRVAGVGRLELAGAVAQAPRQRTQRGVARGHRRGGQRAARGAREQAHVRDGGLQVGGGHDGDCFRVGRGGP